MVESISISIFHESFPSIFGWKACCCPAALSNVRFRTLAPRMAGLETVYSNDHRIKLEQSHSQDMEIVSAVIHGSTWG